MDSSFKYLVLSIAVSIIFLTIRLINNNKLKLSILTFTSIFIFIISFIYAYRLIGYNAGGIDTLNYKFVFDNLGSNIESILTVRFEKGYALFNWIVKNIIYDSFSVFLFFYSVLLFFLYYRITNKLPKTFLSIFSCLLISLLIIDSFNIARMILSTFILFFSIVYIEEKKYLKSFIIMIISASIQMVGIWGAIFIIYDYFISKIRNKFVLYTIVLFSFCIPILLLPIFKSLLLSVNYGYYLTDESNISYFNYIYAILLLLIINISKYYGGGNGNAITEKIIFLLPTVIYVIPLYLTVSIAYRFNYIYMLMFAFIIPDVINIILRSQLNKLIKIVFLLIPILYFFIKYYSYMNVDVKYAQDWILNFNPIF